MGVSGGAQATQGDRATEIINMRVLGVAEGDTG